MKALKIEELDNVAVVVKNTKQGDKVLVDDLEIEAQEDIPEGHKIAIEEIEIGKMILKYNTSIGRATSNIQIGQHVHTHNVEDITEEICKEYKNEYIKKGRGSL